MKKSVTFLLLTWLAHLSSYAQYSVTARIVSPEGNPEEYATFRIFAQPDTIQPIVGDVTQEDGVINSNLPKVGDYTLIVSAMMKQPVTIDFSVTEENPNVNLGFINTELAGETLDELTVTTKRPLVTKEIDRIRYDVQADGESATSSLREILKKVPLVSVDEEGNIKINGSDNFKIYRNGRPNNAFTKNAKDIFAAIPASTIKKIEVITDPGAREDAESSGVILNIITTSTVSMSGLSGNVSIKWQSNFGPQANAFLMTQYRKLMLSASGGYFQGFKNISKGGNNMVMKYDETGNTLKENNQYQLGSKGGWFNVEGSLELDTLNLFTTSLNGFVSKNAYDIQQRSTMYNPFGEIEYSYDQESFYRKNGYTDIDFSFDYQHSTKLKGETLTLSYRLSHTRQDQDQTTNYYFIEGAPFPYSSNLSDFDLKFFEHTFQFDWSRPLGSHYKLDTGAKYILRTSHSINHQNLVDFAQTYDDFKHRYDIFGIYADARATYGKFTARAGVRYEYSRLNAEFLTGDEEDFHANLNDVVPNASISWNASEASMWKLSYNRKIQRPGISYLNPAVRISPNYISFGNPDLKSSTLDNLLLNYSFIKRKFNLDLTLSYSMTNDGIGQLQWTDLDDITYNTYGNQTHSRNITFSTYFQWQITDKTSWMFNGNLEWEKYSLKNEGDKIHIAKVNGNFFTRIQQTLPWNLILAVGAYYASGWLNGLYSYSENPLSSIGYDISLRRSFLKENRLNVSISASNLGLHSHNYKIYSLNGGVTGQNNSYQTPRQIVALSVSWRFGNLRAQVKKTENTITNDDLQGRKN